jgi:uncharacterized protein YqjF (DUF2071 family)
VVRTGAAIAAPSVLERFVTARWGLHLAGRTGATYWPNEHAEWPLHRAELVRVDDDLVAAAGLPRPQAAPTSVLWSPGVRVRFGPKQPAGAGVRQRRGGPRAPR